jgi:ribokinase
MSTRHSPAVIVVVGSANQDYIVRVAKPPEPGETVLATTLLTQPGGKGANQAVAAARLRGNVSFVGAVGDDADGASLLRELRAEGVDTTNVEIINRVRTGLALVSVFDNGENSITVVPGTNFALTSERVSRAIKRIAHDSDSTVMVVQAELLPEIIESAVQTASDVGARSILNLAPYQPLSAEVIAQCDPLVVNESEASSLVGWKVHDVATAALAASQIVKSTRSVVITIGAQGAYWSDSTDAGHVPAPMVTDVLDTTGAGDAFVGALAAQIAGGESLKRAVEVGVLAGSFAVRRPGAQSSYATETELSLDAVDDPSFS